MVSGAGAPTRVLLVEDEQANRALIGAILLRAEQAGRGRYEVAAAGSLAEARDLLRRPFDIVLLDVRLPDGSGLELAAELRGLPDDRRPYVIVQSASVLEHERDAAMQRGADAFLGKPYGADELLAQLSRCCADRPAVTPGRASARDPGQGLAAEEP